MFSCKGAGETWQGPATVTISDARLEVPDVTVHRKSNVSSLLLLYELTNQNYLLALNFTRSKCILK